MFNYNLEFLRDLERKKVKVYWKERIESNVDLNKVDHGLSDWELKFLESLDHNVCLFTDNQIDKLEEIWVKHC